jgi:release factor glutamine methyltransferase
MVTLSTVLSESTSFFRKKNFEHPDINAKILISSLLSIPVEQLDIHLNRPILAREQRCLIEMINERVKGVPIQYIAGFIQFRKSIFHVGPGVLIPRPETSILVEKVLGRISPSEKCRLVDFGTGSGTIAISLAREAVGDVEIVAVERSPQTLEYAICNYKYNCGNQNRIKFFLSDKLEESMGLFDIIVSNPPYVTRGEVENLPQKELTFEPRGALDGGEDGLDYYRMFFQVAPNFLKKNGWILFEIGSNQGPALMNIFSSEKWANLSVYNDMFGRVRIFEAQLIG